MIGFVGVLCVIQPGWPDLSRPHCLPSWESYFWRYVSDHAVYFCLDTGNCCLFGLSCVVYGGRCYRPLLWDFAQLHYKIWFTFDLNGAGQGIRRVVMARGGDVAVVAPSLHAIIVRSRTGRHPLRRGSERDDDVW